MTASGKPFDLAEMERAAQRFGVVPHNRDLRMEVLEMSADRARMRVGAAPHLVGDPARGFYFPGVLFSLADSACGLAVLLSLREFVPIATLDLRLDHFAPAPANADLIADAHCYRRTTQIAFTRCEISHADDGKFVAIANGTFMLPECQTEDSESPGRVTSRSVDSVEESALLDAARRRDPQAVVDYIPYGRHLGIRAEGSVNEEVPLFHLPFRDGLIGNPTLPAIHGGVLAGLMETAALVTVLVGEGQARLPKLIDFTVDYLRSAGPRDVFAVCEILRQGRRVAAVRVRAWQDNEARPVAQARAQFLLADPAR